MPPIPENAVILADYMLMADFVGHSTAASDQVMCKGVRKQSISRDILVDAAAAGTLTQSDTGDTGWVYNLGSTPANTNTKLFLSSFGTNFAKRSQRDRTTLYIGASSQSSNQSTNSGGVAWSDSTWMTTSTSLGVHQFGVHSVSGTNALTTSFEIATPTHTSSHYQEFETPVAYELIGGDRNMEQTLSLIHI